MQMPAKDVEAMSIIEEINDFYQAFKVREMKHKNKIAGRRRGRR